MRPLSARDALELADAFSRSSVDIPYTEGPVNLNWSAILKTVNDDPYEFFKEGGWGFLAEKDEVRSFRSPRSLALLTLFARRTREDLPMARAKGASSPHRPKEQLLPKTLDPTLTKTRPGTVGPRRAVGSRASRRATIGMRPRPRLLRGRREGGEGIRIRMGGRRRRREEQRSSRRSGSGEEEWGTTSNRKRACSVLEVLGLG